MGHTINQGNFEFASGIYRPKPGRTIGQPSSLVFQLLPDLTGAGTLRGKFAGVQTFARSTSGTCLDQTWLVNTIGANVLRTDNGVTSEIGVKTVPVETAGAKIPQESIAVAFASGAWYVANNSQALVVGDRFVMLGTYDFTGGELLAAKGAALAIGDIFSVTNIGSPAVSYIKPRPGFLIEGQKITQQKNSETLNSWISACGNESVTANSTVAPDGNTTADTVTFTAAGNSCLVALVTESTLPGNTYWSFTGWHKQVSPKVGTVVNHNWWDGGDYSKGACLQVTVPPAWTRYVTPTGITCGIVLCATYTGVLTFPDRPIGCPSKNPITFVAWGFQMELRPASSYIVNAGTSAVTRNADSLSYQTAGNIDAHRGTLIVNFIPDWNYDWTSASHAFTDAYLYQAGADFKLYFDGATDSWIFAAGGQTVSVASTHSRGDQIQIQCAWHDGCRLRMKVGTAAVAESAGAYAAATLGASMYVGSTSTPDTQAYGRFERVEIYREARLF